MMKFVTPQEVVYQRSVIAAAQAARAQAQAQVRRPVQRARSIAAAPKSNDVKPVITFVVINPKK